MSRPMAVLLADRVMKVMQWVVPGSDLFRPWIVLW